MPANGLRVNQYDFVALHSMRIIFLKGLCVLVRVEIIHKSKFLPGTVEKNSSTIRSSGRNRTYACAMQEFRLVYNFHSYYFHHNWLYIICNFDNFLQFMTQNYNKPISCGFGLISVHSTILFSITISMTCLWSGCVAE